MAATHGIGPGSVVYCYDHGLMGDLSSRLVVVLGTPVNGRVEVTEVLVNLPPHLYSACCLPFHQIRSLLVAHVAIEVAETVLTYVSAFIAVP